MKKILLLLCATLLFGNSRFLNAQCYGVVTLDTFAVAGSSGFPLYGNTTFNITTANPNELIMISYSGWNGPGSGPVTVDGNNATYVNDATNGNSGSADVYAYSAPSVGTHTIVCSPNGYNYGYYNNFAAAFYCAGGLSPLTIGSLTSTINTIVCTTGGTISNTITTSLPSSAIYCSAEINEGQTSVYPISWTGATFLGNTHTEDGIDAGQAYAKECAPGTYTITATNSSPPANGCGGLTIVLVDIPPTLALGPCGGNLAVTATPTNPTCGNCNGNISINASGGTPPYIYNWSPNVGSSANATGLCVGTFTCVVQDNSCPPLDTTIVITLTGPNIKLSANVLTNTCAGSCSGSATANLTGGAPPVVYSWTPGGQTNATATGLCGGTYTVSATDANGCTHDTTITITQPPAITATTTVTGPTCNGGVGKIVANVAGGSSPYTYSWTPSGQTTATATGLSAGTYILTITDANACSFSTSATITQPNAMSVSVSGPAVICTGQNGTLTANVSGGTSPYTSYVWNPGNLNGSSVSVSPANAQTYTVTVTDANGCTASGQISVSVGPTMTTGISGAHSICAGLSTTLCAAINGGTGGNTYTWQPGNLTTPCITVSPSGNTTYTLTVTDNCNTTATATTTLRVNPLPATAFTTNLATGCAPLCIQFYNTTTLSQGNSATFLWTFGDGDSSLTQSPINCYANSGKYSVSLTVTSDSGCSSTLNKINMITAYPKPAGGFTYSPQSPTILNPTVQFTDKSYDPYNIVYWMWNFGDDGDSVSNLENPAHTYQDTGRYCVSMTEMDEHGCSDTVTNCIVIEPNFNLYIPSAFSPNGDKKNPTFEPKGQYIKSFEMYIFDRWGMQLYHTTNIDKGWDGTVGGGGVAEEDTYVYKIIVTDSEKKQHTYIGNVTLIK